VTAVIDTQETTRSNVSVSPDGRTLVFDMLGDIYSVPIEGGEATALTDGIEWNYQPRFSPDGSRIAFVSHTMINGRLYEAESMDQVAPDAAPRRPLFFEREGGDAWSASAAETYQRKANTLHWKH
jgi:dipeptidyl aminopeptidase/acylaminoacyl peptidase